MASVCLSRTLRPVSDRDSKLKVFRTMSERDPKLRVITPKTPLAPRSSALLLVWAVRMYNEGEQRGATRVLGKGAKGEEFQSTAVYLF